MNIILLNNEHYGYAAALMVLGEVATVITTSYDTKSDYGFVKYNDRYANMICGCCLDNGRAFLEALQVCKKIGVRKFVIGNESGFHKYLQLHAGFGDQDDEISNELSDERVSTISTDEANELLESSEVSFHENINPFKVGEGILEVSKDFIS